MTKICDRYRELSAEFTRRVAAVPAGRWGDPSPCAGWSVRDVLTHMLDTHRSMPALVGLDPGLQLSADEDPGSAWAEARDAMQALLDDPHRAGLEYDGFFGRTSLERTVDTFLGIDLLVHGWDVARATGQDETLPPGEVSRVHADALSLGETLRMEGVCGPAVSVPEDAPEQDKLLGLLGRDP